MNKSPRPYGNMVYDHIKGGQGHVVFLHGFKSDRKGSKAAFLKGWCADHDIGFTAIDMMAHGESEGDMMDFSLTEALNDVLYALDNLIDGPAVLVGSSMGGWLALRAAEERPEKVKGIVGIAAAPDFTAEIAARMTDEQLAQMATQGYITEESGYEEPYVFTRTLIEDGQDHLMLHRPIAYSGPVHLLQGQEDAAVDWRKAARIAEKLPNRADITLINDGDHSLSRPQDLEKCSTALASLL